MNYRQFNPEFEARVRARFEQSRVMKMLGTRLTRFSLGETDIELPYKADICQSRSFIHGGIIGTLLDTVCGFAALSLVPAESDVLTIEYKTNFLAPAIGETLFGRGRVLHQGSSVIVCVAEGVMSTKDKERLVAKMTATLMVVPAQPVSLRIRT
ncbi:MAG: phenylacetic acid degradation protein PaaI [Planctomycetes bacterium GWF2_50_10]|nr:MAG: phenylacetic acid degradation protein PaaI [Planctomycetes bacterium GWF2_50_10]